MLPFQEVNDEIGWNLTRGYQHKNHSGRVTIALRQILMMTHSQSESVFVSIIAYFLQDA